MIPKLIHRIWFGPDPIPAAYQAYWSAWQRQHPDYAFKTWRDSDIDASFLTSGKIAEAQGMPRKADIARYEILHRHGGVYLDCDMMPYQHLDWQKLDARVAVCNESASDEFCSIGMIAAEPGAEIFSRAIITLLQTPLNQQAPHRETGPFFFRRALNHGPYVRLRKETFYPYDSNEPLSSLFERDLARTYGIHVWKGSWISQDDKLVNVMERFRHGDLVEAVLLAGEIGPEAGKWANDYAELVAKARTACIAATGHALLSKQLKIKSTTCFEFLKCAFHLLEKEPDAVIWQIGAADGILADPLRPLAVNRDPRVVMLEPNPYLFERLKQNYARNQNITFLQAGLGATPRKMELHLVAPEKVAASDLPSWVAGISSFYLDRNALGGLTIENDMMLRIQEQLEKVPADILSVDALLAATGHRKPEIVLVDAEGMDGEVVESILRSGMLPKIIQCETQCMPGGEQEALRKKLGDRYVLIALGNDLVAYRTDFFLAYCNELFIRHGIPTIYEDALKFVVNLQLHAIG